MDGIDDYSGADAQFELVNSMDVHEEASEDRDDHIDLDDNHELEPVEEADNEVSSEHKTEPFDNEDSVDLNGSKQEVDENGFNNQHEDKNDFEQENAKLEESELDSIELDDTDIEQTDLSSESNEEDNSEEDSAFDESGKLDVFETEEISIEDIDYIEEATGVSEEVLEQETTDITLDCSKLEDSQELTDENMSVDQIGFGDNRTNTDAELETSEEIVKDEDDAARDHFGYDDLESEKEESITANPEGEAFTEETEDYSSITENLNAENPTNETGLEDQNDKLEKQEGADSEPEVELADENSDIIGTPLDEVGTDKQEQVDGSSEQEGESIPQLENADVETEETSPASDEMASNDNDNDLSREETGNRADGNGELEERQDNQENYSENKASTEEKNDAIEDSQTSVNDNKDQGAENDATSETQSQQMGNPGEQPRDDSGETIESETVKEDKDVPSSDTVIESGFEASDDGNEYQVTDLSETSGDRKGLTDEPDRIDEVTDSVVAQENEAKITTPALDDSDAIKEDSNTISDKPSDYQAKDINHESDGEIKDNPYEISEQMTESLEPFDQTHWEGMSLDDKKEAIDGLRDCIANDLELRDKPEVEYYYNEDAGDFGGYSASENTIYINEYNINDAAETVDTIAHESRHCWQHEFAENSDSPQAQIFRENFNDYVRPEDDYRGYRNQPVETDAREYASQIRDSIPHDDANGEKSVVSLRGDIEDGFDRKNDVRGSPNELQSNDLEKKFDEVYSTKIDDKVIEITQEKICENEAKQKELSESFKDGEYRTVMTKEPITLYRVFGGKAEAQGAFATTEPARSRAEVRDASALKTEWGNTCEKEAVIEVPAGIKLHIGRVEKQWDGTQEKMLKGDADQILLPMGWPESWIKEIREVPE